MFGKAPVITEVGKQLLLRALAGEKITLTKFQVGSGIWEDSKDDSERTAVKQVNFDVNINAADRTAEAGYVQVNATFDNTSQYFTQGFTWREIGLIAVDENDVSYLYAYAYDAAGEELTPTSESVVMEQTIQVIVAVGETENVVVNVLPSLVFTPRVDFDAHLAANNPHRLTYGDVGAAAASHEHGAGAITSGILDVARGGTGVNSLVALRETLGLNVAIGFYFGDGTARRDFNLGFRPSFVGVFYMTANGSNTTISGNILMHCRPGENLYYSQDGASYKTCDADTLFNKQHGGMAVTDNGFAVGQGVQYGINSVNNTIYQYLYIALM